MSKLRFTLVVLFFGVFALSHSTRSLGLPQTRAKTAKSKDFCRVAMAKVKQSKAVPFSKDVWQLIYAHKDQAKNLCSTSATGAMSQLVESALKLRESIYKDIQRAQYGDPEYLEKLGDFLPLFDVGFSDFTSITLDYEYLKGLTTNDEEDRFLVAATELNAGGQNFHQAWLEQVADREACWKFGQTDWKKIFAFFSDGHSFASKTFQTVILREETLLLEGLQSFQNERKTVCGCYGTDTVMKDFINLEQIVSGKRDLAAFDKAIKLQLNRKSKLNVSISCDNVPFDVPLKNEALVFGFRIPGSAKFMTLALSSNPAYLLYRFGTAETNELEFPKTDAQSFSRFTYIEDPSPHLDFTNGDFTYSIYEESRDRDRRVGIRMTDNKTGKKTTIEGDAVGAQGGLSRLRYDKRIQHKAAPARKFAQNCERLINGGFEEPPLASDWEVRTEIPGWRVTGSSGIELQKGVVVTAYEGKQSVELDSDAPSTIAQSFASVAGFHYRLTIAFRGRPGTTPEDNRLSIIVNGKELYKLMAHSNDKWEPLSYDLIARGPLTTIELADRGIPNGLGTLIDAVSVRELESCANP